MLLELLAPDAPIQKNVGTMKMNEKDDELRPHYDFDYSKAKPNRFAEKHSKMVRRVGLDADVADEFPTEESVNDALRQFVRMTKNTNTELPTR